MPPSSRPPSGVSSLGGLSSRVIDVIVAADRRPFRTRNAEADYLFEWQIPRECTSHALKILNYIKYTGPARPALNAAFGPASPPPRAAHARTAADPSCTGDDHGIQTPHRSRILETPRRAAR